MKSEDVYDLEERIAQLSLGDQIHLLEAVLGRIRQKYFTDHEAMERDIAAMAADPDIQRVLRGEDLTEASPDAPR
jgi:hypothetical protein